MEFGRSRDGIVGTGIEGLVLGCRVEGMGLRFLNNESKYW